MHTMNRGQRYNSSNTQPLPNVVASTHCPCQFHVMMVAFYICANPQDSQESPFWHHPWGRIHQTTSHYVVLSRTQLHHHSVVFLHADPMQLPPVVASSWSCNPSGPLDQDDISTEDDTLTVASDDTFSSLPSLIEEDNRPSDHGDHGDLESTLEIVN
jgi:hypothetical protein